MTLSIGPATDHLVTLAQAAVTGVTVNGQPVAVVDGQPDELTFGMFVIGLEQPPPEPAGDTTGTRMWVGLGAKRTEEDYTIPCYIDVRIPGTQKAARDLAAQIFDAFWTGFSADLTLGGAVNIYAEITNLTSTPSSVGTAAEPGRRQLMYFGVHCRNRTT